MRYHRGWLDFEVVHTPLYDLILSQALPGMKHEQIFGFYRDRVGSHY
jgi:hypothetical protein